MKNIVFDMGNVLIRFEPDYFVDRLGITDKTEHRMLINEVYRSPMWPMLDSRDLTEEILEEEVKKKLPENLHRAAHKLIFEWYIPLEPVPGMKEFAEECKACGCNLYLLSNASLRQKLYWPQVPCNNLFSGRIVSAEHRCVKPSPQIYRLLLQTYNLKAQDCFFIDDLEINVKAAQEEGMHGCVFKGNIQELRKNIRQFLWI